MINNLVEKLLSFYDQSYNMVYRNTQLPRTLGIGAQGSVVIMGDERNMKAQKVGNCDDMMHEYTILLKIQSNGLHPNIINLIDEEFETTDIWRFKDECSFQMQRLIGTGKDCIKKCEERKASCCNAYEMLDDIRKAVRHLHSLQIWHNDIKLENIGFSQTKKGEKTWKLFDFGSASNHPLDIHEIKGTPGYISTFRLEPGEDVYGDVWSLFITWLILRLNLKPLKVFENLGLLSAQGHTPKLVIMRTLNGCSYNNLQSILVSLNNTGQKAYDDEEIHLVRMLSTFMFQRLSLEWYEIYEPDKDEEELQNEMLSKMLLEKQTFTEDEFASFRKLYIHERHYVKTSEKYFKPVNFRKIAHDSYKMLMPQFLHTCGSKLLEYTPKKRNHGIPE